VRKVLADTGPLVALLNRTDSHHQRARVFFGRFKGVLYTTWPVLTETCHLLPRYLRTGFMRWVAGGGIAVQDSTAEQAAIIAALMERYADRPMDLADASLICLADKLGITNIITIDQNDFDTYRTGSGKRFNNRFLQ
jgi:predicted nucleic acid-binding protein